MKLTPVPTSTHLTTSEPRIPGPSGLPLLGNMHQLLHDNLGFVVQMAHEYGDVVRYRLGPMPIYQINSPEGVQHILQDNNQNYSKDSLNFGSVKKVFGNGLLSSHGEFWLRQRRLMQPVFHRRRVATFGELMSKASEEHLAHWAQKTGDQAPLDIQEAMMALTLDIVLQALFNTRIGDEVEKFGKAVTTLLADMTFRFLHPYYPPVQVPTLRNRGFLRALKTLEEVIYQLVDERRQLLAQGNTEQIPDDLLTLLIQARDEETGEGMSDRQLRDETLTLYIAGHETTALTLTWACYLLARHVNVAQRLEEEVAQVLAERSPTLADLPQLPFLRSVVDETQRLYPPAWILNRQSIGEDEIGGYRIPAHSFVAFSPYVLHRHPEHWENPAEFDPERFVPERVRQRHRYAYLPFGGGPRQCIGRDFALCEAQLILATVLQRYRLHLLPGFTVQMQPLITLRPLHGLPMMLEPRS